ncbi:Hypothetical Protein FCC1311_032852 [Hondaea fermentalgiana]|uniref:Uncharacterized protein n=1 Tax=Hondaea fermentalgiana TaxID=2315210 RepID=A0A2R5G7N7_9STRA|nr:Hypothetical Protein FCC1311_032852 [Hondaea fermentalgiana]|eukprot:GBG27062.1 Hypothetical Protein FCC1311_032852 [Hondaea fermentalgiana]
MTGSGEKAEEEEEEEREEPLTCAASTARRELHGTKTASRLEKVYSERFYNPQWPSWVLRHTEEVQAAFFVLFALLFVHDAKFNALGSANGRFISIVDTVNSVSCFRKGLPKRRRAGMVRFMWVLFVSFVVKFAAGSVISVLLGATPVILKGPRHMGSFFIGFLLVWHSPGDVVYRYITKSDAVKLMVCMCCGLYKLRKALFAVECSKEEGDSFAFAFTLVLLALDGNSVLRKGFLWFEKMLGIREAGQRLSVNFVLLDAVESSYRGLRQIIVEYMVPDFCVAFLIYSFGSVLEADFVELRIGLLVYFAWRQNTFGILAHIHRASLFHNAGRSPVANMRPVENALATIQQRQGQDSGATIQQRQEQEARATIQQRKEQGSGATIKQRLQQGFGAKMQQRQQHDSTSPRIALAKRNRPHQQSPTERKPLLGDAKFSKDAAIKNESPLLEEKVIDASIKKID